MAQLAEVENRGPIPPQNLEAEESVLGAFMLVDPKSALWDAVLETGLVAGDFYRESHSRIFRAQLALRERGMPADAISLTDELHARGELDGVGGRVRLHELTALVPATANAPHYARLVVSASARRSAIRIGGEIAQLGWSAVDDAATLALRAEELAGQLSDRVASNEDLKPLWWHEAIHEPIPATSEYVDGVLQAGVLADIVGLPYLHKTALALELASKVAVGAGELLGKYAITAQANAAYFWSDDSRAKELERIQAYARASSRDGVVPLAFYLNSGLTLPDGIPLLKAQIRRHGFRLVVLDSLYNFAPGLDWVKDTAGVSLLYHHLKRLCDQVEGLTIVLVDHASKPSDSNRGRDASIQSYGSVWKAAAVRSSIVITKDRHGLKVTAVGNNISGFPPAPVVFDDDRLELRILEIPEAEPDEELDEIVLREVERNPGAPSSRVAKNVGRNKQRVLVALRRLEALDLVYDAYGPSGQLGSSDPRNQSEPSRLTDPHESVPDPPGTKQWRSAWFPVNHAANSVPGTITKTPGTNGSGHGHEVVPELGSQQPPLRSRGLAGTESRAPETDDNYLDQIAPDDIDWTTP